MPYPNPYPRCMSSLTKQHLTFKFLCQTLALAPESNLARSVIRLTRPERV